MQLIARLSFQSIGRNDELESSKLIFVALTCFEKKAFFELLFLSLLVFYCFPIPLFFARRRTSHKTNSFIFGGHF